MFFAMIPVACFSGAITATIAWYDYATHASVAYHGTAISIMNLLQIGIKTDLDLSAYGLTTENGVAWAKPGFGLEPTTIEKFFQLTGYADKMLTPLTSGEYYMNDDLVLKAAPSYGVPINDTKGDKSSYCFLPLAFRTYRASGKVVKNQNVWLSEASILCQEYEDLKQGVRLHFKNNNEQFIVHPSKTAKGYTTLAGLQDLNIDGYYDCSLDGKEIVYGHYLGDINYTFNPTTSGLVDINETGQTYETTFLSRHQGNRQIVTDYNDLTFTYAEYETVKTVGPQRDLSGTLIDGKPVCVTGEDGIGYVDMTLWVEGWDHSVYDNVAGYKFLTNLSFIINAI